MGMAGSIEAVLTLDSSGFTEELGTATSALNKFANATKKLNGANSSQAMRGLNDAVIQLESSLQTLDGVNKRNLSTFSRLSTAISNMAKGLRILQSDTLNVDEAVNTMNSIFRAFQGALSGTEIKVKGVSASVKELTNTERQEASASQQVATATRQYEQALSVALPKQREMIINATGVANAERQEASASQQVAMAEEKQSVATDKATNSMRRQETASKGLKNALSSIKMMGAMVGSMLAYNFAHNLAMATTETINAKSEMNGYFQMLGNTTRQTQDFNKALDDTVKKFPRLNKYALGETVSSIGVEFELTTAEMKKAMPVVSMITSEYLRAGRNVNEASLAVKDILQGEFQRLSRETGVKGDQLKEAGWSGDNTDVMGLLEALEKVGKERNWDTFVQKANSLNDAVLILQNRFSEWASDMVSTVQPAILNVFNSLLSFSEGLSQSVTATWEWLSGDSLGALATKLGLLLGTVLSVTQAFTVYRTGMGLVQTSQLGFTKQLASVVLGLKGQEIAEVGVRNAIMGKILGVKAETIAESGVTRAIQERMTMTKLETVEEKLNTLSSEENTTAKKYLAIQEKINNAEKKGLIATTEAQTLAQELELAVTEEQEIANGGLTASLYLLGTGEVYVAGETSALATAMGVLNGVIELSPIGWFMGAVLALAGAFYVLSGGLDESWGKMKQFHEVMKDPSGTIEPYKNKVNDLTTKLEEAKSKYGENSTEVDKLQKKLDTAKGTLDSVTHAVEHGAYWNDQYTQSFEGIGSTIDDSLREVMKSHGYTKEQIDTAGQLLDSLSDSTNETYRAIQVMVKQQDDAKVSMDEFAQSLDDAGIKGEEATDKISDYASHLQDLQTHSAIANTTDDWWEWLWNSFYAGLDQMWIDMDEFFVNLNWDKLLTDDALETWDNFWSGLSEGLSDWQSGAVEFLEPLNQIGDEVNKFIDDPLGYLNIDLSGFDLIGSIMDAISSNSESSSGGSGIAKKLDPSSLFGDFDLTEWFDDNIKKPVMDWWNGFISFDWLPSFDFDIGSLFSGFFGTEDSSTTDPTTNPLVTWVNTNIVTPLTNFAFDPIGTIASWGLSLPQVNLGTLIQGLFSIGGEGGFDIGGWLSSIFDISGIVSTFTSNLQVIFTTASSIASNVSGVFSNLKSMIWGHIQGILSNVTSTFTNIKNTAVTQINGLSQGIQGGIDKVKNAFIFMKDSILDSAKKIYDGVKAKFDSVKTTIGDFWHKLTNPSSWGSAGSESYQRRSPKPHTARKMFSPVVRGAVHHGAGINPYQNDSQTVKLKDLMDMVNGDNKVRLSDFLAMFSEGGFGTWDFHEPVKTKVFDTAKGYKTGSPNIKGIGTVGSGYEVRKFWNGKPSFSFEEFQAVAQAIFSAIPYKFYYDSEWKGNWVNALLSGAVNCSDGADALIALANVFGLSGYKQHTTLKSGVGHFFAVIGGKPMDTTNFQNHGSWSPLGGAGIPTRTSHSSRGAVQGNTTNHTVNVTITGDVYGVDDLESRIEEGVKRGLRDEFNDPYTVAI